MTNETNGTSPPLEVQKHKFMLEWDAHEKGVMVYVGGTPIKQVLLERQMEQSSLAPEKWMGMVEKILDEIKEGKQIVISGPKRTGKTEVCRVLKYHPGLEVIYLNAEFMLNKMKAVEEEQAKNELAKEIFGAVRKKTNKPVTYEEMTGVIRERAQEAKKEGKILVIFTDEFQSLSVEKPLHWSAYKKFVQDISLIDNVVGVHSLVEGPEIDLKDFFESLRDKPNFVFHKTAELIAEVKS